MAFVPAPLPPPLNIGTAAIPLANAMQALGELKGACRRLQNPSILVSPLQRQEALTSSAMEGTYTTDDRLLLAEVGVDKVLDESTREVSNYLNALNSAIDLLKTIPISHRMLKNSHERLLSGLSSARGAQKRPGEYKREQNWIGGRTIEVARFVPPPPDETQTCMDELERYINRDSSVDMAPLLDLALVHYQLETIHPFADGNGRVGRMLISLMAVSTGLLEKPVLYMSPVLEENKDSYIDLMLNVSTKGEWQEWLTFFFEMVIESCRRTVDTIDRLIALQSQYRSAAVSRGRSASAVRLVDHLFELPAISVTHAALKLNSTYNAAKKTVGKLVDLGILVEIPNEYPKIFYAPAILRVSRETHIAAPQPIES